MQRKRLSTVGERHGPGAGRVDGRENINAGCYTGQLSGSRGDEKAECGEYQGECHQRECYQQQVPAAKRIDRVEGGQGKEPINQAHSHARQERLGTFKAGRFEDGRGVIHP